MGALAPSCWPTRRMLASHNHYVLAFALPLCPTRRMLDSYTQDVLALAPSWFIATTVALVENQRRSLTRKSARLLGLQPRRFALSRVAFFDCYVYACRAIQEYCINQRRMASTDVSRVLSLNLFRLFQG